MKKNIIGILVFLSGILLITAGVLITTDKNSNNKKPTEENEKNTDIIENPNNDKLQKKQCLENICINDLEINKQTNVYSISATIENNRETEILDTALNLIFTAKDGTTIKKTQYIHKLQPKQTSILEIQFAKEDESLMKVTNYKIEYASEQEKEIIKQSITD